MESLTIRELDRDESGRRFGVRLFESENVLTEAQLRALRDAADAALNDGYIPPAAVEAMCKIIESQQSLDDDIIAATNAGFWDLYEPIGVNK